LQREGTEARSQRASQSKSHKLHVWFDFIAFLESNLLGHSDAGDEADDARRCTAWEQLRQGHTGRKVCHRKCELGETGGEITEDFDLLTTVVVQDISSDGGADHDNEGIKVAH
jgi:hypothetical protein